MFFSEIGVSILELDLFFINFALANKKEGRLSKGPSEIERTLREQERTKPIIVKLKFKKKRLWQVK